MNRKLTAAAACMLISTSAFAQGAMNDSSATATGGGAEGSKSSANDSKMSGGSTGNSGMADHKSKMKRTQTPNGDSMKEKSMSGSSK